MRRFLFSVPALLLLLLLLLPGAVLAQRGGDHNEGMIRSARSAAIASVADHATIMDHAGNTLHQGSKGWVCMPDMPDVPNNSSMCLDRPWLEVIDAWMNRREPNYQGIGFGYMLQGDMPVSNTDPFATAPAPGNQWIQNSGPHIMMLISDHEMLENLPTDPDNGGPWVMWKGTPYAHVMIPTVPREP